MILDRLEHASSYQQLSPLVVKALDFLRRTDLSKLPAGRNEIDGDQLYAMAQRYQPRNGSDKAMTWESHRKYIDIQYVVSGRERMGCIPLSKDLKVTRPYDDAGDAALYEHAPLNLFIVPAGYFALFSPQDVHAPGVAMDPAEGEVLKIVMKVRVDPKRGPNGF
jgi:YhcH/YjgK/YiaL family protein